MPDLRIAATDDLSPRDLVLVRALVDGAFGTRFTDHDWEHALGGTHVLLQADGVPLAHASVVARTLVAADRTLRTGYVEAVATQAVCRRNGYATEVMGAVNDVIGRTFDLGSLATGAGSFYERLGWEKWQGPTFVLSAAGRRRTPEDDDGIYVLRTAATADLDLTLPLACEDRVGDAW